MKTEREKRLEGALSHARHALILWTDDPHGDLRDSAIEFADKALDDDGAGGTYRNPVSGHEDQNPAAEDAPEISLIEMLVRDNNALKRAGSDLAAAAARVTHEHDGVHRLSLETAKWHKAVADEGGRSERHTDDGADGGDKPIPSVPATAEDSLQFLEETGYRISPRLVQYHHDRIRRHLTAPPTVPEGPAVRSACEMLRSRFKEARCDSSAVDACVRCNVMFLVNELDHALAQHSEQHPDDAAVDRFAEAMKAKLAEAREKGRGGWDNPEECTGADLARMLIDHLHKDNDGTFEDVANFAMMLHQRGEEPETLKATFDRGYRYADAPHTLEQQNSAENKHSYAVPEAVRKVMDELARAREKFPQWPDDPIHAATVVSEEAGELAQAALQSVYEPHKQCSMHDEAVQTAAMAIRFLENMQQYEMPNTDQHDDLALAQHGEPGISDYDRSIHSNSDQYAWADFFMETWPECGVDRDTMAGWFANAMMAKVDSLSVEQHSEPGRAPEGWKLVPVEPTQEMIDAAQAEMDRNLPPHYPIHAYRRMLAAAPAPDADEREDR